MGTVDFRTDRRVIPFLSKHPCALIYHHPAWLNALQEESGQQCQMLCCESSDGLIQGLMPIAYTRGLPFNIANHQTRRRISSLPRTPFVGPISTSPEATRLMLIAAIERAAAENVQLQIKMDSALPQGVHENLVCTEWRPTYVLSLPESADQLTFRDAKNRHRVKWGINKAAKLGLSVRCAETLFDLENWYVLYLASMRRNFVPPRAFKFFVSLWRELKETGLFTLLLAERATDNGNTLAAGSIFLMTGKTVSYAFTGALTEQLSTHANDIILWNAIQKACGDGYRFFDFGEVPEEHPELVRFKTKWGAVPKQLYRHYCPYLGSSHNGRKHHWPRKFLARAWQHVPLSATARVGVWIYSYL